MEHIRWVTTGCKYEDIKMDSIQRYVDVKKYESSEKGQNLEVMMCLTSDCTESTCRRNNCGLCWLFIVSKTVDAQWKKLKLNCPNEAQTTIGRSVVGWPDLWPIDPIWRFNLGRPETISRNPRWPPSRM